MQKVYFSESICYLPPYTVSHYINFAFLEKFQFELLTMTLKETKCGKKITSVTKSRLSHLAMFLKEHWHPKHVAVLLTTVL
jgi:hypothetical protein